MAKSFQRRFTDVEGKLYVFDKCDPRAGVRHKVPKKSFVQRDLNTIEQTDGSRDTSLEAWYSKLETEVAPTIEKIVDAARARRTPNLTEVQRNVWDNFSYHQQKRAPDIFRKLGLEQRFGESLEREIAQLEREIGPLPAEVLEELKSPKTARRMIQHASVHARGRGSEQVIAALAERGIAIAMIAKPNKSFILGDHPMARMGPDGNLGHPATELWFPIASDVAVSPWGPAFAEKLYLFSGDDVRRVNTVIAENSNIIAGRSEALIRSLAGI